MPATCKINTQIVHLGMRAIIMQDVDIYIIPIRNEVNNIEYQLCSYIVISSNVIGVVLIVIQKKSMVQDCSHLSYCIGMSV